MGQEQLNGLIETIFRAENGGRLDYNVVFGGIKPEDRPPRPITSMTVREVLEWQDSIDAKYQSEAAGAIQIMEDTLRDQVKAGAVSLNDRFDEPTQKRLAVSLMRRRGLDQWMRGEMTTDAFGTNLAKEWASLPTHHDAYRGGRFIPAGNAFYGGVGANHSRPLVSLEKMKAALKDPSNFDASGFEPTGRPGEEPPGKSEAARETRASRAAWDSLRNREPSSDLWADRPGYNASSPGSSGPSDTRQAPSVTMAPREPDTGYRTSLGPGGYQAMQPSWGRAFQIEWQDSFIVRGIERAGMNRGEAFDPGFDPIARIEQDGLTDRWKFLADAQNEAHYEKLVGNLDRMEIRQRQREAWDGTAAQFLGGMLNPDSLVTMLVPGTIGVKAAARTGANFLRTGATMTGVVAAVEAPLEAGRASLDPYASPVDSAVRVAATSLLGGLLGGAAGEYVSAATRRRIGAELSESLRPFAVEDGDMIEARFSDVKAQYDIVKVAPDDPIIKGRQEAVFLDETTGQIRVNSSGLIERFTAGAREGGARSVADLMHYEIGRVASAATRALKLAQDTASSGRFSRGAIWRAGETPPDSDAVTATYRTSPKTEGKVSRDEVSKARVRRAIEEGKRLVMGRAEGDMPRLAVDLRPSDNVERVYRAAKKAMRASRDPDAGKVEKALREIAVKDLGMSRRAPAVDDPIATRAADEQADHFAGVKRMEEKREVSNRLFKKQKAEGIARMADSGYRRVHRNSFSNVGRDLADLLAGDGGNLRVSDGSGQSVGPSVYSRAKVWNGWLSRVHRAEVDAYERYLGWKSQRSIGGLSLNAARVSMLGGDRASGGKAMTMSEFRTRVSKARMLGTQDDIPEINELVRELDALYAAAKQAGEEFTVLDPTPSIQKAIKRKKQNIKNLRFKMGRGASEDTPEIRALMEEIEELEIMKQQVGEAPSEDYFTRMFKQWAIRENREAFKNQILMPFLASNPWVQVWKKSTDELQDDLAQALRSSKGQETAATRAIREEMKDAPDMPYWDWQKTSGNPADIERRADEIIQDILDEAEPAEAATMRSSTRPTYGRRRQINIPNRLLLKEENGIEDFIETDYMHVAGMYIQRMAPAIEFARTFHSKVEGGGPEVQFKKRVGEWKAREKEAFEAAKDKGAVSGRFEDHWAPLERDILDMKDAVTNNVTRDPTRWDNRTAQVLKNWSHLAFMGMSALPATQEIGMLVTRFGFTRTFGAVFGNLDRDMSDLLSRARPELRNAGANMDVMMSSVLSRNAEVGSEVSAGTLIESGSRRLASNYFLANGLSMVSHVLKDLAGSLHVMDFSRAVKAVQDGTFSAEQMENLNRYGISRADALAMADQPMERLHQGEWMPNTDAWADESLRMKFRSAIFQATENTVMTATMADKPTITNGVVNIRKGGMADKWAQRMGLESQGDYWRMQSGLLTLPFGFWNYGLAATQKVLASGVDQPTAQKAMGLASLIGMGYIVAAIRTDGVQWDAMTFDEKVMRSVDQSGVLGVMPQYGSVVAGASIGVTGRNQFSAVRDTYAQTRMDAVFDLMGAGPSVARNAVLGVSGDMNSLRWSLPFSNHFAVKWIFDDVFDGLQRGM